MKMPCDAAMLVYPRVSCKSFWWVAISRRLALVVINGCQPQYFRMNSSPLARPDLLPAFWTFYNSTGHWVMCPLDTRGFSMSRGLPPWQTYHPWAGGPYSGIAHIQLKQFSWCPVSLPEWRPGYPSYWQGKLQACCHCVRLSRWHARSQPLSDWRQVDSNLLPWASDCCHTDVSLMRYISGLPSHWRSDPNPIHSYQANC